GPYSRPLRGFSSSIATAEHRVFICIRSAILRSVTMPVQIIRRLAVALVAATAMIAASACQSQPEPDHAASPATTIRDPEKPAPAPTPLKNEIPAESLSQVMRSHFEGLGYMEQYEYAKAVERFRKVHELAPGWIPGAINMAIALLNDTGVKVEAAKKARGGAGTPPDNFDEALKLLADVLDREPDNPYAHFCRGIILEQQGSLGEAHRH